MSAIKFLVLSRCNEEAFELARKHSKLDMYGEILLNSLSPDEIKPEDFNSLALYFENERNYLLAGRYWYHSKDYQKVRVISNRITFGIINIISYSGNETFTQGS